MTAAATAYSSTLPPPELGATEPSREASMTPEKAAIADEMTKQ